MSVELFGEISNNYVNAAKELWSWHKYKNIVVKILMLPWVVIASATMKVIALIFMAGIIFDKLSLWLERQRKSVIAVLENKNRKLAINKSAYILSPILAGLLAPIALLLGIFPKWSSTLMVVSTDDSFSSGTEHGFFFQLSKQYFLLVTNMLANSFKHGAIFWIVAIPLTLIVTPIALIISLMFLVLTVLDILSWLVELIRQFIVSSSAALSRRSGSSIGGVIFYPTILVLLVPVYLVLLLIPKISSQTEA